MKNYIDSISIFFSISETTKDGLLRPNADGETNSIANVRIWINKR